MTDGGHVYLDYVADPWDGMMMDIGAPIRRFVAVPEDEPITAPEPAVKPLPKRRREREKEPA